MSVESAEAFVKRMRTDEDFAKKVMACKDAGECRTLANLHGYSFTENEMTEITNTLSEDDLAKISGGFGLFDNSKPKPTDPPWSL